MSAQPQPTTSPPFTKAGHAGHCIRCLQGLPASQVTLDPSSTAIGFYSLGCLDILGLVDTKTIEIDRQGWKTWFWELQSSGAYGTAFKGSTYMTPDLVPKDTEDYSDYDTPNLIMTYTAILSLAILRDDLSQLDREGLIRFMKACQREDGSFSANPDGGESDMRSVYCAFVISSILNDWSGVDVERAIAYIQQCASYEGGYGQSPHGEALGGTTYCALASLLLAPSSSTTPRISAEARSLTIRWLIQNQTSEGGFSGRTNKAPDACYCFWCGASLFMLGAGDLIDSAALAEFLFKCQFKFGGVRKAPEGSPDPYHTYMAIAALSISPPPTSDESLQLARLDVLWNTTEDTARWLREHVPVSARQSS